jgi:hypothetical protein
MPTTASLRVALAAAALVFATGFTQCEYFSQTTVPAQDADKPTIYNGTWKNGLFQELRVDGATYIDHEIEPGESILVVGAGVDPGGVKKVTIEYAWSRTCCYADGKCGIYSPPPGQIAETQSGTVGAAVSNGVWAYAGVEAPVCAPGTVSSSFDWVWSTTAEDFHGNRKRVEGGTISYHKP